MVTKPRKKSTPPVTAPALPAPIETVTPRVPAISAALPPVESGAIAVYRDAASLAKENLAVFTAVHAALSEGFERIGLELLGMTRATLEDGAATAAALLDARTLADVATLNGEFARACVDRLAASAMRLSELAFATASDVYEPLGARLERAFTLPPRPLAA